MADEITVTTDDIRQLERLAVLEAQLGILISDFKTTRERNDTVIKGIREDIGRIYDLTREFPSKCNKCQKELEHQFDERYMTKTDAKLMEQNLTNLVSSVKIWIVSTVAGFTSAAILIAWALNFFGMPAP